MTARFDKRFGAEITIRDSEDYPGLTQVSFLNSSYSTVFLWTGRDLAEGVALAISSVNDIREIHNAEYERVATEISREQNAREEFGEDSDPQTDSSPHLGSAPLKAVADEPL